MSSPNTNLDTVSFATHVMTSLVAASYAGLALASIPAVRIGLSCLRIRDIGNTNFSNFLGRTGRTLDMERSTQPVDQLTSGWEDFCSHMDASRHLLLAHVTQRLQRRSFYDHDFGICSPAQADTNAKRLPSPSLNDHDLGTCSPARADANTKRLQSLSFNFNDYDAEVFSTA